MMRSAAFGKVYRSFEEFERDELRKLDGIHLSVDDLMHDMFAQDEEGGGDELGERRKRGRPRKIR